MEIIGILDIVASSLFIVALVGICILSIKQRKLGNQLKRADYDLEVLSRLTAIEDTLKCNPLVNVEVREEDPNED